MGILAEFEYLRNIIAREKGQLQNNLMLLDGIATNCELQIDCIKRNGEKSTKETQLGLNTSYKIVQTLQKFNNDIETIVEQCEEKKSDEPVANIDSSQSNILVKQTESNMSLLHPLSVDLSMYKVSSTGFCEITFVEDIKRQICYIIDLDRSRPFSVEIKFFSKRSILEFEMINTNDNNAQVFGIGINGCNYRATWAPDNQHRMKSNQICLIDTGEIINIDTLRNNRMFLLPENIKSIPAHAIRSKIVKTGSVDLTDSMKNKLFNFKVVNVAPERQVLDIEISTNPFDLLKTQDGAITKDELDEKSKEFIRLDYRQSSIVNRNHDDLRTQRVWKPGCSGITFRTVITRPTHTQNEPSESGTAITPNPATNCGRALLGCVLGGSPILPNIPPRPVHMVTKASDNPDIIQPIPRYPTNPIAISTIYKNHVAMPEVGDTITITPTRILNVEQFYARILLHSDSYENLVLKMNCNQMLKQYRRYSGVPENTELILVMLNDGLIHRAKAKVVDGLPKQISVMCLDTGITQNVTLKDCYYWEPFCSDSQFQAVRCRLINVEMMKDNDKIALKYFQDIVLNKFVAAQIFNVRNNEIFVKLIDDAGYDIGELLCVAEMGKYKFTRSLGYPSSS